MGMMIISLLLLPTLTSIYNLSLSSISLTGGGSAAVSYQGLGPIIISYLSLRILSLISLSRPLEHHSSYTTLWYPAGAPTNYPYSQLKCPNNTCTIYYTQYTIPLYYYSRVLLVLFFY